MKNVDTKILLAVRMAELVCAIRDVYGKDFASVQTKEIEGSDDTYLAHKNYPVKVYRAATKTIEDLKI